MTGFFLNFQYFLKLQNKPQDQQAILDADQRILACLLHGAGGSLPRKLATNGVARLSA